MNHGIEIMVKDYSFLLLGFFGIDKIQNTLEHIPDPNTLGYSALFEMFFILIEKLLDVEDTWNIYILRHTLNFTIYFLGLICFCIY